MAVVRTAEMKEGRRPGAFCDLHRVGGFFAAVRVAVSISAVCGAVTMITLQAAAPFWDVWRTWFLPDAVGILVVAPRGLPPHGRRVGT